MDSNQHETADSNINQDDTRTASVIRDADDRQGGVTADERVRERRDALETIAESDLPCDWIAEALLETVSGDSGGERL